MNQEPTNRKGWERIFKYIALAYLILLPLNLRLGGQLFVHDLLLPAFLVAVFQRGTWRRFLQKKPEALLSLFLLLAAGSTLINLCGARDLYELAVFAIMILIYGFFAETRFTPRELRNYAYAVFAASWLVGLAQIGGGFLHRHGAYEGSTLGFLATRFQFSFDNPNLAASYYLLPAVCLFIYFQHTRLTRKQLLPALGLAAFAGIPPLLTVSRHLIQLGALGLAFLITACPLASRRLRRSGAILIFALVFVLFYTTILVPFFPLQKQFPFINCATGGMYTTHQDTYLKIICDSPRNALIGVGGEKLREAYPQFINPVRTREILKSYNMEALTPTFLAYMDAHCEYLNTAALFGIPAMLCLFAFWIGKAKGNEETILFLTLAVLASCLWDDLLSKRWVWLSLALLANHRSQPEDNGKLPDNP